MITIWKQGKKSAFSPFFWPHLCDQCQVSVFRNLLFICAYACLYTCIEPTHLESFLSISEELNLLNKHLHAAFISASSFKITSAVCFCRNGWSVIQFPPSLKMSTYLVAFAVGPFVNREVYDQAGTLVFYSVLPLDIAFL